MKREADHSDMGSPLKRSRSGDDVEVRFLIPSKIAGSIIGKGGNNITKLRTEYKATITVPDCPGPERMLTICAEPDTVVRVLGDIIPHIEDMSSREDRGSSSGGNRDGDGVDVRMLVHQSQAGCIIGKGGLKVKDMREKTGARIKIYTNCCPSSTDRVVQISGRNQTCVDCVREILDLLRVTPIKGPNTPYDPHNYDEYYAEQYGGFRDGRRGMGGERGPMGNPGVPGLMGGMGGLGGGRFGGRDGPRDGPREGGRGPMGGGMGRDFGGRGPPRGGYGSGGGGGAGYGGGYGGGSGGYGAGGGGAYGGGGGGGFGGAGGGGGGGGSFGGPRGASNGITNPAPMNVGGGGGGGGGGGAGGNSGRSSTQVTIPKDLAGAIIGKGGSRIRKIRNESGAGITIDEPLEGSNDRIITIVGLPNQIQMAQYLLQQSVHESADRY